jgi:signal transduction histidine kinase
VLAYLALARVVSQGSRKIISQDSELREKVRQLSALLDQNAGLHDRLRRAAARSTALNELERRRIGSDLHDGPSQTLAFAMLRLDAVESRLEKTGTGQRARTWKTCAVRWQPMRSARCGPSPPACGCRSWIEPPRPRSCGGPWPTMRACPARPPTVDTAGIPDQAPLATKIALYRILSEALSNAARHGGGAGVQVAVTTSGDGYLVADVRDRGPGFDVRKRPRQGHLGLAGMRERAELLGGRLELESSPEAGTHVRAVPAADRSGERRAMTAPIRIVVADDHPLFLDGLVATLVDRRRARGGSDCRGRDGGRPRGPRTLARSRVAGRGDARRRTGGGPPDRGSVGRHAHS